MVSFQNLTVPKMANLALWIWGSDPNSFKPNSLLNRPLFKRIASLEIWKDLKQTKIFFHNWRSNVAINIKYYWFMNSCCFDRQYLFPIRFLLVLSGESMSVNGVTKPNAGTLWPNRRLTLSFWPQLALKPV